MSRKSVRRSQAITPFGVGALVDFPNESLMAAGLDVWPEEPECQISDARLAHRLGVDYFRAPPPPPQKGGAGGDYLPFIRFPLWQFCPRCRTMREALWNDTAPPRCNSNLKPLRTGAPPCGSLPEKRRWRMVPLRFITACEQGHVDDFPWVLWAHSRPGESLDQVSACTQPVLRFNFTGKAGLMGLLVKCEACDAKTRSMMGSAGAKSLKGFTCAGKRPWLGPHGNETCTAETPPRMLQRGATNLYFSKIASSILIPPFSHPIRAMVDDPNNWRVLGAAVNEDGTPDETRLRFFGDMKRLNDSQYEQLVQCVKQKLAGEGVGDPAQTEEQFRFSEYEAMLGSHESMHDEFITQKPDMATYGNEITEHFESVVLVKKLAETRVLTGFSRLKPPAYREYSKEDQNNLSLQPRNWLPGIRVYGEGVFLTLRKNRIEDWIAQTDPNRYAQILQNHQQVYQKLGRTPRKLPMKFFLLHALAHILIRRLSFECGYGSSSLRERIYCYEGGDMEMNGMLIYTAAGDSEGTMGGLVEQGKAGRLEEVLRGALADAIWCSSDPLCIESHGQGIDSLNRAACHACALLPETSCEEGNRFLDRGALIGTPESPSQGFFGDIVKEIVAGEG